MKEKLAMKHNLCRQLGENMLNICSSNRSNSNNMNGICNGNRKKHFAQKHKSQSKSIISSTVIIKGNQSAELSGKQARQEVRTSGHPRRAKLLA